MKHSIDEVVLKNGAKGLLIDVPNATVMSTRIGFRAGMRYAKNPSIYELPHIVEHLAFGANSKFKDEQAFEAEFTKNGAYHNAWTSDLFVCYETECADFEWDRIIDLQRLSICTPRFNEEELKSEKSNVRSELTSYLNDYYRLLWPRLQHEVGEGVLDYTERLKTISNIDLKDVNEHYRRTHTTNNMFFIIAGKVHERKREIIRMLENWELKPGERFEIPKDDLHSAETVSIRRKDASNITFGFSIINPRHLNFEENFIMASLNHILNGTTNSKIFGAARKQGLIYGMGSSTASNFYNSYWDFDGEVNLENAEKLFNLIANEIKKVLRGDISENDFEAAKSYALGRFQMGVQTVSQIADYYLEPYFTEEKIRRFEDTPKLINAVTKDKTVALANEFVNANIKALVTVSSAEKAVIDLLTSKLNF